MSATFERDLNCSAFPFHQPVMVKECLKYLNCRPGATILDATLGTAGHSLAIAECLGESGRLFGIDCDPQMVEIARERLREVPCECHLIRGNYAEMERLLFPYKIEKLDGILFDLGACALHFLKPERGFSLRADGPLDMRYDPEKTVQAKDLVNSLGEKELADLFRSLGGERRARRLARLIVQQRAIKPIQRTRELALLAEKAAGRAALRSRIHPATKLFQSLRVAVNREMENLRAGLEAALRFLSPGGRIVVIGYQSGEHREVKKFLRRNSGECVCPPETPQCVCQPREILTILTKRAIAPQPAEIEANPRARSAQLRAAELKRQVQHLESPASQKTQPSAKSLTIP